MSHRITLALETEYVTKKVRLATPSNHLDFDQQSCIGQQLPCLFSVTNVSIPISVSELISINRFKIYSRHTLVVTGITDAKPRFHTFGHELTNQILRFDSRGATIVCVPS